MPHAVRAQIALDAPLEIAWAAWAKPEHLRRWYPDRVDGEFVAGTSVRLYWDCFGFDIELDVLEVSPHERLVVRGDVGMGVPQTQDVRFRSDGDGTIIDISHDGILEADQREGTTAAWQTMAGVLRTYIDRYFGHDRQTFACLGPARVSFDRLFDHYTNANDLSGWLGTGTGIGAVGDEVDIATVAGARLRGSVLARSEPREVAITCDEINTVLAFRAVPLPGITQDEKLVGAWGSVWHDDPSIAEHLRVALNTSIDKLVSILQW
jgi:uncharacterized protein YndB with AHSA1/START domain